MVGEQLKKMQKQDSNNLKIIQNNLKKMDLNKKII